MLRAPHILPVLSLAVVLIAPAAATEQHALVHKNAIKWEAAPNSLPPGAQAAVLGGDPAAAGNLFTIRLKAPDGYIVPPHWHSQVEAVTVVSGTFKIGMGDKVDAAKEQTLTAGDYVLLPGKNQHYAKMQGETVIDVNGIGPFDITYIDPKDDPRAMTGSSK